LPKKEMDASPSVATGKIKSWRYCAKSLTIRRKHHSFVKVFSETFFRYEVLPYLFLDNNCLLTDSFFGKKAKKYPHRRTEGEKPWICSSWKLSVIVFFQGLRYIYYVLLCARMITCERRGTAWF
jgi:hypothetical protein